jgi:hypothetical protein
MPRSISGACINDAFDAWRIGDAFVNDALMYDDRRSL